MVINVKIVDTVKINEIAFLHITGSEFSSKEKDGYILLGAIRAILPSSFITSIQSVTIQKGG